MLNRILSIYRCTNNVNSLLKFAHNVFEKFVEISKNVKKLEEKYEKE